MDSREVSGTKVRLVLFDYEHDEFAAADTITLRYTVPATNPLQDRAGNRAPAIQALEVTLVDAVVEDLNLERAAVTGDGRALELTYDREVDEFSRASADDFSVLAGKQSDDTFVGADFRGQGRAGAPLDGVARANGDGELRRGNQGDNQTARGVGRRSRRIGRPSGRQQLHRVRDGYRRHGAGSCKAQRCSATW